MTKYEEYQICKERGHISNGQLLCGIPPKYICEKCGATFWTEFISKEENTPGPDNET